MNDQNVLPTCIFSQGNPTNLTNAVLFVQNRKTEWIEKDLGGAIKADSMLGEVCIRLKRIPFKIMNKRSHSLLLIVLSLRLHPCNGDCDRQGDQALLMRCSASITFARIALIRLRWPGPFDFSHVSTSFSTRREIRVVLDRIRNGTI